MHVDHNHVPHHTVTAHFQQTTHHSGAPLEPEPRELPAEVAVILMVIGLLGIILPGPTGTPLFIAGASAFVPGLFQPMERWTRRRFPRIYRQGRAQLDRFLDDLERRYPTETAA